MNPRHQASARRVAARHALVLAAGFCALIGASATSVAAQVDTTRPLDPATVAPAEQLGRAFAAVAAHIRPAVVSVYSEKLVRISPPEFQFPFGDEFYQRFFGRPAPPQGTPDEGREYRVPQRGMGSGMILDRQGHILTNYHVVSEVDEIRVQLADQRSFEAKIVGSDPKTDVAIIQIKGQVPPDLPTVQLGDSDALQVGNLVLAVGAPFGLTQTVTFGIISAKGRSDVGIAAYEDFLQTDAPINPGNSGGPLVNMRGEVIGMNSAIATGGAQPGAEGQSAGVGFAIPVNMIRSMLPTLIRGGQIRRGMLGVVIQNLTDDLAAQFRLREAKGALVSQVNPESPAEKAGLEAGDVIVRFDGKPVRDTRELRNLVAAAAPGSRVDVVAVRDGRERSFRVTVGNMPAEPVPAAAPERKAPSRLGELGLGVTTLTPEMATELDLEGARGVLITEVEPGGPASAAGLQEGDLIVEAGRKPVADVSALQRALASAGERVLLLVKRRGASQYVVLPLK